MLDDTDWLLLSGNNLGSLNKATNYLNDITLLNLSSSYITDIDDTVMAITAKSVKNFDIRKNQLKTLPRTIRNVNESSKFWISDNPYECNCDMIWMKDWLVDTNNIQDKDNVTCSAGKMKGREKLFSNFKWFKLFLKDFAKIGIFTRNASHLVSVTFSDEIVKCYFYYYIWIGIYSVG